VSDKDVEEIKEDVNRDNVMDEDYIDNVLSDE